MSRTTKQAAERPFNAVILSEAKNLALRNYPRVFVFPARLLGAFHEEEISAQDSTNACRQGSKEDVRTREPGRNIA
jgi:hypothetical protein